MTRRLLICCLVLFGLCTAAHAQHIVIGPPDDRSTVDTSIHESAAPTRPTLPIPSTAGIGTGTTLDLSQLDCSLFPSICGYVDVLDGNGNPIPRYNADSFCVFQNGVPIPSFTVQQLTAGNCPTSVCLVVDVSGSMTTSNRLDSAKAAMHTFVNNMDVYDQVAIVKFSDCWSVHASFTSNKTTLHNAINTLSAGGFTAAFDGVWKGVDITRFQLGSKAVIAFTDGVENRSNNCAPNPPDGVSDNSITDDSTFICNLANSASIPIYTFNLGPIDSTWFNPRAMKAFANGTGGFWSHAPNSGDIDSLYSKIKQRLCSRYYICYQSLDTIQNGNTHWTKICRKSGPNCTLCDSLSCQEKFPPEIVRTPATINLSNSCQSPNSNVSVCAWVTDDDTPKANLVVTLFYRTGPSSYTSIPMSPTGPVSDSTFCATIPASALSCKSFVDYYITASDGQATVSSPAVNPQVSPHNFALCPFNPPVANAGADQTIFQCTPAQICWTAGCTDPDGNLKSCVLFSGPGSFNGSQICFTPTTSMNYEFVLKATDSCDQVDYDTVVIYYTRNTAPVANAGADQTVFQCTPTQICWAASCTDVNNNLSSCQLISGTGTYNGSQICFTPASSGAYQFILQATDSCNLTKRDTAVINVTINSAPVCTVPANETISQCAPTQVCRAYSASDVNGNFRSCSIVSGPGSLVGGNWCYTPSVSQTVNVTIRCEDSCNAYCESSFQIIFNVNSAPVIAFGNDTTIFQCTAAQICANYTVSDANNNLTLEQLISGSGTIDTVNNRVCFTPGGSGANTIIVQATDACGITKRDTIVVTVNLNAPPVIALGVDQSVVQCTPASICLAYTVSDPNNNVSLEQLFSGPGTIDTVANQVCFTPAGSGTNTIIVQATDACGLTDRDTIVVTVTVNSAPTIAFGNDSSIFLCTASSICIPYTVSDPNGLGKIVETMVSGYGSIDTALNRVCFTPSTSGAYQIIVQAMDSCGTNDRDTINVTVTLNSPPVATNPPASVDTLMCASAQVCRQFAATDVNGGSLTWAMLSGSGTVTSGGLWCFTPASSGSYSVVATVSDACGAKDTVSMTYNVTLNTAPVVTFGADINIFQCSASQICVPYTVTDANTNVTLEQLYSGPGSIDTANNRVCFTPAGSGTSTIIVKATDGCGLTDQDTIVVTVTINSAPTIAFGADTSIFLCTATSVCVNYTVSDPNGLAKIIESMVSGVGAIDSANNRVCFTPASSGSYQIIVQATDSCGAFDKDTINVSITLNSPPVATNPPASVDTLMCASAQVCRQFAATDVNGGSLTWTKLSGSGTVTSGGLWCFTPASSGSYSVVATVSDACGAKDTVSMTYNVTLNSAPTIAVGADFSAFQCAPVQICVPYTATDPNNNITAEQYVSGPGSIDTAANTVCFTPVGSGPYTIIVGVTDACGLYDRDTIVVNVTVNGAPTIAFGNDTSILLCQPTQVCMTYSVSDPNGLNKLTEVQVSGFGSIDTLNNKVCFTPSTAGMYDFIVSATDSCGATDRDTIRATITFGQFANITCPTGPILASLCAAGQVCQAIAISPVGATVTTSFGTYSGGNLCFQADTSGTYVIRLIATASCGADTCDVTFNVTIGSAANITCPVTQTRFVCTAGASVCTPITVLGSGATVTVTPIGSYSAGNVCFNADTSGHYVLKVKATTTCGSDSCFLIANVTTDAAPVAVNPPTPKDTFMCASAQICYQFSASDINGGSLTWTKLIGSGTVSGSGQWCFTPTVSGSYSVTASVADSCGKADTTTLTYNVTLNSAPTIAFGNDTTVFVCAAGLVCLPYTVSDPNNNANLAQLIPGLGTIDTVLNKVCFTPASTGSYTFIIKGTDACGLYDNDTILVTVSVGQAADVTCPATQTRFVCAAGASVCAPVTVTGSGATVIVTPIGSYSAGNVCFNADTSGHYVLKVKASTTCGSDSCFLIADVTIDAAPVAVNPATPKDTFMCASAQICYQFSASDINGGALTWTKLIGSGTVSGSGQWCFTPTVSGSYSVTASVADSCGKADTTTLTYNVTLNSAPTIAFGSDTTVTLCVSGSVCVPYTITDPNNNSILEQLISGSGTIDSVLNKVCFAPLSSGGYTFIIRGQDACGAFDFDTIQVTVMLNSTADVTCPGAQTKYLCAPGQICYPVTVTGASPTVSVSPIGTYSAGTVCFTADTSGLYTIRVIAASACGTDTCFFTVTVTINLRPVAVNPPSSVDTFMCASAQICRQFSATDPNGSALSWTRLSGAGTVTSGGLWCFTAASSGAYNVVAAVADSCGAADTVTMTYNVTLNGPPIVQLGNDLTLFQCSGLPVCVSYTVTDPNSNANLEQLISGPGTIDTVLNKVCFTPSGAGTFTIIVGAVDACGSTDRDTVIVTIDVNDPPTVNAGVDKSIFQCTPTQYCFPITSSDPDNNIDSIRLISGPGTINAGQICFTPASSGQVTFIVKVFDRCSLTAQDTVRVTVQLNAPPVCSMPDDTTKYFQCAPTQVSLPVFATDPNGNFSHCQITSGPGSLVGGNWVYTPSGTQTVKVVVQCLDSCAASCIDSFYVKFTLNRLPVANAGRDTTVFLCNSGQVCVPVSCSDPDGNLQLCEMTSVVGAYSPGTGMVCINADYGSGASKAYPIIMKATDSCGAVDYDTSSVTINFNRPPVVQGPPDMTVYLDQIGPVCFDVTFSDPDNNCPIDSIKITPIGTYNPTTQQVCFTADSTGHYCLILGAVDHCGLKKADTVCIDVQIDECIHVQIEKVHNAIQGQHKLVNIFLNGAGKPLGGFDFLIAYDASSLSAMSATEGSLFGNCGWEYFTYRFGPFGNCGNGCPSGMIRVTGIAETSNGAYHPTCFFDGQSGILATLDFLVSNDRTLECQCAPVQFFWLGCGDNTFSSVAGDTLYISRWVYDFEFNDITDNSFGFPGFLGSPDSCLIGGGPGKPRPARCVDFTNGGVDIICADSIDARGDINLNGLAYEIADAVMFTNYFIHGLSAFAGHIDGSVAATDVNGDGLSLTVGDLVYLIRVIVGDALQLPKLNSNAVNQVTFTLVNNDLSITETSSGVGAIYLQVEGDIRPTTQGEAASMDMVYRYDGTVTRILISTQGKNSMGVGQVLKLDGARSIKLIEAGSFEGYAMKATLSTLPTEFTLSQNYPNPFNPVTNIDFTLPHAADWQLQIYNVLGQVVQTWSDHGNAGYYQVAWDASQYASGVYFYRLSIGSYSATKKMVLLK